MIGLDSKNKDVVRIMDNIVRNGVSAKISALEAVKIIKYINYVESNVLFGEKYDYNIVDDIVKWSSILGIVLLENEYKYNKRSSTLELYDLL